MYDLLGANNVPQSDDDTIMLWLMATRAKTFECALEFCSRWMRVGGTTVPSCEVVLQGLKMQLAQ